MYNCYFFIRNIFLQDDDSIAKTETQPSTAETDSMTFSQDVSNTFDKIIELYLIFIPLNTSHSKIY